MISKKIFVTGPVRDHSRRMSRAMPQRRTDSRARRVRACDAFITEWARHGYGQLQLDDPAAVLAALQRVLAGGECFPRDLFVAARRFQTVRTS